MTISLKERDRRYSAIRELMKKSGLDCLVVASRDTYSTRGNTRYITNHGNNFGEELVVFPIEEDPSIIASAIRGPAIQRGGWVSNFIKIANVSEEVEEVKKELSRLDKGNKIGIVGSDYISVPAYLAIEAQCPNRVVDATWIFSQLRIIKSPEEIEKIRTSALISDKTFIAIRNMLRPGLIDYDIYSEAKRLIHQMGCEYSMELINGHFPRGLVMKANDTLNFEFTPAYEGYYTQLLVEIPVGEYPSDIQKLMPIWEEALAVGVDNLRPGKKVSDVHQAVSTIIHKRGSIHIAHRFGHSIGLDVIDSWQIVASDTTELKPGMTLAFHPGVNPKPGGIPFAAGYTYLITETGAEKLNKVNLISTL